MFEKGQYIVYGIAGPCLITDITRLTLSGCDGKRKYYVLRPMNSARSTIYSPIDNEKVIIRQIMTAQEAESLLRDLTRIRPAKIENEKQREDAYKEIMKTADLRADVGLLKTLYKKRASRLSEGRKFTTVDEKYLRDAEGVRCSELSIALGEEQEETTERIRKKLDA